MEESVEVPVSVPGLRAVRWTTASLHAGVKENYGIGRIERGRSEWWGGGKVWRSAPRCIQVKQPGDVHRDLVRDGPTTWTVITLPATDMARLRDQSEIVAIPQLEVGDGRAAPFHRLFDAVGARADRLSVEVALAEALSAFTWISRANLDRTRAVRRAMDYLRARLADSISLADLAVHADLDKFHLCRAFRAQIGMPPHTYLTHLRIARAKDLLRLGVRAADVAHLVGLYDQAQLTRHFRRIVGTTPARYQRTPGMTK